MTACCEIDRDIDHNIDRIIKKLSQKDEDIAGFTS